MIHTLIVKPTCDEARRSFNEYIISTNSNIIRFSKVNLTIEYEQSKITFIAPENNLCCIRGMRFDHVIVDERVDLCEYQFEILRMCTI